jgi:hypothetical protein
MLLSFAYTRGTCVRMASVAAATSLGVENRATMCVRLATAPDRPTPRVSQSLSGLGGGQRALEGGPVGRPAVRRKHVFDRQRK